jgi:GT2 family glycosyltransferase
MKGCTVVVPVHGHAGLTRRCLDALLAEPAIAEAEVVVVDDASPDDTAAVLAGYGERIRVRSRARSGGFAVACQDGASMAKSPLLLFLNNDAIGEPGWLGTLLADAAANPGAEIVGAKLLYPDRTVQHAGVAFGTDRLPRHIYAGFPADHPAVNRSRPLQAVTGACMLVRRRAWERNGGFDTAYVNGLEDVDFCLRVGEEGGGVRLCHEAVLVHLESPTRGRRGPDIDAGLERFKTRWSEVRPDDLEYFLEDGLLRLGYSDTHPIRLHVDPLLASIDDRADAIESLLVRRAAQVNDLLREVVRLSVALVGAGVPAAPEGPAAPADAPAAKADAEQARLLRRAQELEAEIAALQAGLAAAYPASDLAAAGPGPQLRYHQHVACLRGVVREAVPSQATVMVVSRGDEELLDLDGRSAWHFPQAPDGRYSGHHPGDSAEAISHLEELRAKGGEYLLFPRSSLWWLEYYEDFARHLRARYAPVECEGDACALFALSGRDG